MCTIYFNVYKNKEDYVSLVSSHMAKSIISYAGDEREYKATIFLDKVNNRVTTGVSRDIKRFRVHFKKIRALDDSNNVGLKFADAICGLIRDMDHEKIPLIYKEIYKKLKEK